MKFYITKDQYVACVDAGTWSMHYENEEPDGYTESPFQTKSAVDLGWQLVSYEDLPDWAQEQIETK